MVKKVLVIDDDADMSAIIQRVLKGVGYEVAICDNGNEAWNAILMTKPNLLILDVMLPGIDGYSLQTKIDEDEAMKKIPIIVLTSLEPARIMFQRFDQVAGFLIKPFKTQQLIDVVERSIGKAVNTDVA